MDAKTEGHGNQSPALFLVVGGGLGVVERMGRGAMCFSPLYTLYFFLSPPPSNHPGPSTDPWAAITTDGNKLVTYWYGRNGGGSVRLPFVEFGLLSPSARVSIQRRLHPPPSQEMGFIDPGHEKKTPRELRAIFGAGLNRNGLAVESSFRGGVTRYVEKMASFTNRAASKK